MREKIEALVLMQLMSDVVKERLEMKSTTGMNQL